MQEETLRNNWQNILGCKDDKIQLGRNMHKIKENIHVLIAKRITN